MAFVVVDRVWETSTTTGTGTYTLAGAKPGDYRSFGDIGDGNSTFYYATDGEDWEVGVGTYTASGTTLARTAILVSSNSNAAVNWSAGTRDIYCTNPAARSFWNLGAGLIKGDGAGQVSAVPISSFAEGLLDDTSAGAMRATLDLEPGTDVMAYDAELAAIAGLTSAADKGVQFTGAGTAGTFDLTAAARDLLDDTSAGAMRTTLGVPYARKQNFVVPAAAMRPRSANGPAALATSNGASNQPDTPYLAFDGAAAEYAIIGWLYLPESYDAGTIRAKFAWRRASGTGAANVVWGIRAVAISDNASPAVNFGTGATVTDAASTTTANFNLSGWTSACTIGNTPSKGDLFAIEVYRDGAAGGDTLNSVDAWLSAVIVEFGVDAWDDTP